MRTKTQVLVVDDEAAILRFLKPALEANGYFSRPGPRLATGIEILAKALHPSLEVSQEAQNAILAIAGEPSGARTASA